MRLTLVRLFCQERQTGAKDKTMKLILASLIASASLLAAAQPNPSTLIDQTIAQTQAQRVAEHYATATIPSRQAAVEPTREEEYRRNGFHATTGLTSQTVISRFSRMMPLLRSPIENLSSHHYAMCIFVKSSLRSSKNPGGGWSLQWRARGNLTFVSRYCIAQRMMVQQV